MDFPGLVRQAKGRDLLTEAEQIARDQARARSEVDREAVERQAKWLELVKIWKPVAVALVERAPKPDEMIIDEEGKAAYLSLREECRARDTRARWWDFETPGEPSGVRHNRPPTRRKLQNRRRAFQDILDGHLLGAWDMFVDSSSSSGAGYGGRRLFMGEDHRVYFGISAVYHPATSGEPRYGVNPIAPNLETPQGDVKAYEEIAIGLANLVARHSLQI